MKKISNPIIYFGTERLSLAPLKTLISEGFNIVAVVTKPDSVSGRGRKVVKPEVKVLAEKNSISVLQPGRLSEIISFINNLNNPIGILASYGKIVPQKVIDTFKYGILNIHPSLLPKYRGPSPIETCILNGDEETGVTIMGLTKKMDAGPIYAQKNLKLTGNETKECLYKELSQMGIDVLIDILPKVVNESLLPSPQKENEATYTKMLDKSMSTLDVVGLASYECERQVRAFAGWPKTRTPIQGEECIITKATTGDSPSTEIDMVCKDGRYLIIEKLMVAGGREMSARDFINGYIK